MKAFEDLTSELFNNKTEEFTSVSVRLTPESGFMLKALSSNEALDFSISKMFSHTFSELIASDVLSYYSSKEGGYDCFKQLMMDVQSDDRFCNGRSNRDAVSVITQENDSGSCFFKNDFFKDYCKNTIESVIKKNSLKKDK